MSGKRNNVCRSRSLSVAGAAAQERSLVCKTIPISMDVSTSSLPSLRPKKRVLFAPCKQPSVERPGTVANSANRECCHTEKFGVRLCSEDSVDAGFLIGRTRHWREIGLRPDSHEARDEVVDMCFFADSSDFETNKTEFHQRTQTSYKRAPRVHGPWLSVIGGNTAEARDRKLP